jgi:hypothetical protein
MEVLTFTHNFLPKIHMKCVTGEDGTRFYTTPEGNSYKSVTTFLKEYFDKPYLKKWKKNVGEKKAKEIVLAAQKRGKSLHWVIETYLLNNELDLSEFPVTKGLFVKIKPFVNKLDNIRLMESPLYSDELKLAGSPDVIADYDGVLSICDFKSNTFALKKRIDLVDYMLQVACYAIMFNERFGLMPKQAVVIIASPNNSEGVVKIEKMDLCIDMLRNFMKDPAAFNAILAEAKEVLTIKKQ